MAAVTSWVHGTSLQAEYMDRLVSVRHVGPFARVEGQGGQNTWVHFPIPSPASSGNGGAKANAVLLNFRTRGEDAWVHEVVLYDGAKTIAEHRDLHLSGDHSDARFDVPGTPGVELALNVTVGIMFGPNPATIQSTWMEFIAAGCEFVD